MFSPEQTRAAVDAALQAASGGVILEVPPRPSVDTPSRMYDYTPDVLIMSHSTSDAIRYAGTHLVCSTDKTAPTRCFGIPVLFDDTRQFAEVKGAKILR